MTGKRRWPGRRVWLVHHRGSNPVIKDLTAELDRLYARYQALEEQKRPLLERISELGRAR